MIRGLVLGIVIAIMLASCVVRQIMGGPRLTGTCDGACAHYISCKSGGNPQDKQRCDTECPDVFGDRESLMAYESLSCRDAVEYVDGSQKRTAAKKPAPQAQPATMKR